MRKCKAANKVKQKLARPLSRKQKAKLARQQQRGTPPPTAVINSPPPPPPQRSFSVGGTFSWFGKY